MKKFYFLMVLICLVSQSVFAQTASDNKLVIASFPFPPLLHKSITGEFSGTMGESVKLLCERAGLDCQFKIVPLKRAHIVLEKGEVDALVTIKLAKFEKCCISSAWQSPWTAGIFSDKPLEEIPMRPDQVLGTHFILVQGMRSPYLFMPDLTEWETQGQIKISRATDIYGASRMYEIHRAPFLWGSDDFNWYFEKINAQRPRNFRPLITKQVVLWLRKEKSEHMTRLNKAFEEVSADGLLRNGLLIPKLMETRYKDAPFKGE